jgi:hypothetical protein
MRTPFVVVCGLLLAATPSTSSAQIGGLIRKAKDAAASKAENKVVENSRLKPSEAFGPELTEASLDAVLRGLAATQARLGQTDRLREERERIDAEWARSSSAHEKERQAYDDVRQKAQTCQDSVIQTRSEAAQAAYMKRMESDPAAQAALVAASMEAARKSAALQAKGDTAGVHRLALELAKTQGIDPKADSAVAVKTCGAIPPKPAWLVEQTAMRERSAKLDSQIREAESGAQSAGATASGMSMKDYSLARERVLHYSIEAHGGSPIQRFGDNERKLLDSRRSDIDKYRKVLN